jgi:hypothetical protein
MPTVLRVEGFRFYFYSHEPNGPPHVHVDRGGASAKIWLDSVSLARSAGFTAKDLVDLLRLVRGRRKELPEAWHGFFGTGASG